MNLFNRFFDKIRVDRSTFIDRRDGHTYRIVEIGNQTWFAENLAYKATSGCWSYDKKHRYVSSEYGYFYDWETAKIVSPSGWHLPSDDEWTQLIQTH